MAGKFTTGCPQHIHRRKFRTFRCAARDLLRTKTELSRPCKDAEITRLGRATPKAVRSHVGGFRYLPNEKASTIVAGVCLNSFATTSRTVPASSSSGFSA